MILAFARKYPWGDTTNFVEKIKNGTKQHTFRIGHRWKVGMKIHFWDQNPRSTMMTPKPEPFNLPMAKASKWIDRNGLYVLNQEIEYKEQKNYLPIVTHIEDWEMNLSYDVHNQLIFRLRIEDQSVTYIQNYIHSSTCPSFFLDEVSRRDGFDSPEDFIRWFAWDVITKKDINSLSMEGQIIHWTNKIYTK